MENEQRVWMVENEASDDEQNILITIYATADGSRYARFERAVVLVEGHHRVPVSLLVGRDVRERDLAPVRDPAEREQYRRTVASRQREHAPEDRI